MGFKNWDRGEYAYNVESPSSIESSPPPYDVYDYDIDEAREKSKANKSSKGHSTKKKSVSRQISDDKPPTMTRIDSKRLSTEERMKEILERNKVNAVEQVKNNDNSPPSEFSAWENSLKDLMKGIGSYTSEYIEPSPVSDPVPAAIQSHRTQGSGQELASPRSDSDSFEMSEADMEVGLYAARRSQERVHERKSSGLVKPTLSHASPNIKSKDFPLHDMGRHDDIRTVGMGSQASALSSIRGGGSFETGDGITRYASGTASDTDKDLYRALVERQEKSVNDTESEFTLTNTNTSPISDLDLGFSKMIFSAQGSLTEARENHVEGSRRVDDSDGDDNDDEYGEEYESEVEVEGEGKSLGEGEGDKRNESTHDRSGYEFGEDYSNDFESPDKQKSNSALVTKPAASLRPASNESDIVPEPVHPISEKEDDPALAAIKLRWLSLNNSLDVLGASDPVNSEPEKEPSVEESVSADVKITSQTGVLEHDIELPEKLVSASSFPEKRLGPLYNGVAALSTTSLASEGSRSRPPSPPSSAPQSAAPSAPTSPRASEDAENSWRGIVRGESEHFSEGEDAQIRRRLENKSDSMRMSHFPLDDAVTGKLASSRPPLNRSVSDIEQTSQKTNPYGERGSRSQRDRPGRYAYDLYNDEGGESDEQAPMYSSRGESREFRSRESFIPPPPPDESYIRDWPKRRKDKNEDRNENEHDYDGRHYHWEPSAERIHQHSRIQESYRQNDVNNPDAKSRAPSEREIKGRGDVVRSGERKLTGLVAPSRQELLAHLATLSAAPGHNRNRNATSQPESTAPKRFMVASQASHRPSTSASGPPSASRGPKRVLELSEPKWDALNRMERTGARLQRQFEELDNQMQSLKGKKIVDRKHVRVLDSSEPRNSRKGEIDGATHGAAPGAASAREDREADTRNVCEDTTEAMTRNSALVAKEKQLVDLERSLSLYEMGLRQRDDELRTRDRPLQDVTLTIPSSASTRDAAVNTTDDWETVHIECARREDSLNAQVRLLKQQLNRIQEANRLRDADDAAARGAEAVVSGGSEGKGDSDAALASRQKDPGKRDSMHPKSTSGNEEVARLRSELDMVEGLVRGYQRENERLAATQKERELEEREQRAAFLQEREALNKELNRLRNQLVREGGSGEGWGGSGRRTADTLRAELAAESARQALEETKEKEREAALAAMAALPALKEENMRLLSELTLLQNGLARTQSMRSATLRTSSEWKASIAGLTAEDVYGPGAVENARLEAEQARNELAVVKEAFNREREGMLSRLRFFADTQSLLTDAERETQLLRKELASRGINWNEIREQLKDGEHSNVSGTELSFAQTSVSGSVSGRMPKRNTSETKRIRELESALKAAQDALRKRYPDSLANLVQATHAAQDEEARSVAVAKKRIQILEIQLAEQDRQHTVALRALRQQHEQLRLQYDDRVELLEKELLSANASAYSAKVTADEANLRSERLVSMAVTRKEGRRPEIAEEVIETKAKERHTNGLSTSSRSEDELKERLQKVEQELLRTAEELGRERAVCQSLRTEVALADKKNEYADPGPLKVLSEQLKCATDHNRQLVDQVTALTRELSEQCIRAEEDRRMDREKASSAEERLRGELERTTLRLQQAQLSSEQAEAEAALGRAEIAVLQDKRRSPQTPQMTQFVAMEGQLRAMEDRLRRRDAEVATAVEESRAAGRLERARLQALHEQELREKDEQLVHFQEELQLLVLSLRKQTLSTSSSVIP